jgi:hypothetical protein
MMSTLYQVQPGDTLSKIARAHLGSPRQAVVLAEFNGLRDVNRLRAGHQLLIPSARDLVAPDSRGTAASESSWPPPPAGLSGIIQTFGDLYAHIRDDGTIDPRWEQSQIARAVLPFPIPLDWDMSKQATGIQCHRLLVPLFTAVFQLIVDQGLQGAVKTYAGCYNYRPKRNGSKPSTHSWGIAIDLNARSNGMGTAGDMDPALVALFESHGFVWGGRWSGKSKDPMHFQYCSGY